MADFTFLHVFGLSLVVTTLRSTVFNPMSLMKTFAGAALGGGKGKPNQSPISALLGGLQQAQKQLAETNPEAAAALGQMTGASAQ